MHLSIISIYYGKQVKSTNNINRMHIFSLKILDKINLELNYPMNIKSPQNYFIADISGKDSIAALLRIVDKNPSCVIVPSIIELACEYGDKKQFSKVIRRLNISFNGKQRKIMPCIIPEANDLWKEIVTDNIQKVIKSFSFYSPCIACHLVLHLIRIKIAKYLKVKNVISGERELHSGREKINQLPFVLDFYNMIYKRMKIKHHLPLRHINNSKAIDKLIERHNAIPIYLNCLFAGNYYSKRTFNLVIDKKQIQNYVEHSLPAILNSFEKKITVKCRILNLGNI